jgi:protein SCO1/2
MRALLAALLLAAAPAWAGPSPGNGGARWGAAYFPNVPLVTHQGKKVRFFDDLVAGKVVVISFIYTSCPDACPLETARLAEVQKILGDRVGKDVFMYSISIDPEVDTPAVMASYAARYQAGPGWLFLTGKAADIKLLRSKLGLTVGGGETSLKDHNLSLVIGNQSTGQWMKRSPFENPYLLATQLGDWLHNWKRPPRADTYAHAPKLREPSAGETLFRTRCAPCHLVGPDDGLTRSGPNLLGVTERRDRRWLARWLAAPDEMLAKGDPVALQLYGSFNKVPMPNMKLADGEVTALVDYLDAESGRLQGRTPPARRAPPSSSLLVVGSGLAVLGWLRLRRRSVAPRRE